MMVEQVLRLPGLDLALDLCLVAHNLAYQIEVVAL